MFVLCINHEADNPAYSEKCQSVKIKSYFSWNTHTIAAIHVYDTTPVKKLRVVRTNTTYLQCIAAIKVHLNEIYTVKALEIKKCISPHFLKYCTPV